MRTIRTKSSLLFVFLLSLTFAGNVFAAGPKLTPAMKATLDEEAKSLQEWVKEPIILNAVKEQNAKGLALDGI